jgi:hypothetical protein
MIGLLRLDHIEATEFAPPMEEGTRILPGLPAVAGKPCFHRRRFRPALSICCATGLDFVSWKDRKPVAAALKDIYPGLSMLPPAKPHPPPLRMGLEARNIPPSAKAGAAPGEVIP